VDETGAEGDYFTDVLTVEGVPIKDQQMAVALTSTCGVGIWGIGYSANVAARREYPTAIDNMVTQGIIDRRLYSLWLDDRAATHGQILFGGIDPSKFEGSLTSLPLQPEIGSIIASFTVVLTGISIGAPGSQRSLTGSTFDLPVLLDSGTTLTYLPDDIFADLVAEFDARDYTADTGYVIVDCNVANSDAVITYRFGSDSGPTINVPLSEVITPVTRQTARYFQQFEDIQDVCALHIMPAGDSGGGQAHYLLGDTFLRSAYVVYDIDNDVVAIAQTNFDADPNNEDQIVEIKSGEAIPNATGVSNPASATAAGTGAGGVGDGPRQTGTVSGTSRPTAASGSGTGSGSGSGAQSSGANAPPAATSTGAAAALRIPAAGMGGVFIGLWVGVATVAGGLLFVL
jgi:hypothetical protein